MFSNLICSLLYEPSLEMVALLLLIGQPDGMWYRCVPRCRDATSLHRWVRCESQPVVHALVLTHVLPDAWPRTHRLSQGLLHSVTAQVPRGSCLYEFYFYFFSYFIFLHCAISRGLCLYFYLFCYLIFCITVLQVPRGLCLRCLRVT